MSVKNTYIRRHKSLFERKGKPGLIVIFGQFPCSRIRIRIPKTDTDPRLPSQCGSMRILIPNTGAKYINYIFSEKYNTELQLSFLDIPFRMDLP
jgi:hypothetical protein